MTAGALIQIAASTSDRMAFLCLNPSITHFKSVYKKHTAFSLEYIIRLPTNAKDLDFNNDSTVTFDIKRDADLIKDMYLQIDLPDIYSTNGYNFQWIERIGEYIIRDVSVTINGTLIDKQYGEWLHIWSELTLTSEKRYGYDRMIGNTIDIYDPANAPGNNGIYPDTNAISPPETPRLIPSIKGRRLTIPLRFWFNNASFTAFPLIALQYSVFTITFNLRPLKELYTVIDVGNTGYRIRPNNTNHYIGNFLKTATTESKIDLNPNLEINYIFLDKDERKQFAISTHEYLITQIQRIEDTVSQNSTNPKKIMLSNTFKKPVTEFIFIIRRSDNEACNKWSNYTNWNSNIAPYSPSYTNENGPLTTINSANFNYFKDNEILKSANILINGQPITQSGKPYLYTNINNDIEGKDRTFYTNIMNFAANKRIPNQGIYTYSFSLSNNNKQPDGALNMSNISDVILNLYMNEIPPNTSYSISQSSYDYHVYIYAVNYEALRIIGGIASVAYAN